jgi:cytosine/adenosine deaminase-related metal-dependent hydrolase
MSVVYCPRTHAYFGHDRYPLAQMLAAGVNLALGTDSRASNPDLNLLEELRHVAQVHSDVPLAKVLQLGTLAGAKALGVDKLIGTLEAGKQADLAIVPLNGENARDPHELVLHASLPVAQTYIAGRIA